MRALYLDITDVTLISRIAFSFEIFIQIYVNVKKEEINLALIVASERVYGIDKEGGIYHEHPFENPLLHIPIDQIGIEDFVMKCPEYLKKMKLV